MSHNLSECDYLPERRSRYNQYVIQCCSYEEGEELFTVLKDLDLSMRQQRCRNMSKHCLGRMKGEQDEILDMSMGHNSHETVILCTPSIEVNKILYQWASGTRQIKCQNKRSAQKLCQMLNKNGVNQYLVEPVENSPTFVVTCPRSVPATTAILNFYKKYPNMAQCVDKHYKGFPPGFVQRVTNLHSL